MEYQETQAHQMTDRAEDKFVGTVEEDGDVFAVYRDVSL